MRNSYVYNNQFEDTFYVHGKTIVINYITLEVKEYEGKYKSIFRYDAEADVKLERFLKLYKAVCDDNKVIFTLVPSYNCNMQCIYCYEGRHEKVDVSMYNNMGDFLRILKKEYSYEQCEIILLGGEPVCRENIDVCEQYIEIIKKQFEIAGIVCISNGLEIKKFYEKLKKMGVTKYQITLDGVEDTHNKRRPAYKNFKNSFVEVCNSIELLLDQKEDLEIRINIDKDNLTDIEPIIDLFFKNKWYKYIGSNLKVYLYPISENGVCSSLCYSNESEILREVLLILRKLPKIKRIVSVRVHGIDFIDDLFHGKMPLPIFKFCGANSNQFVFAPDGYVYPCWWGHDEQKRVGKYSSDVYINKELVDIWRLRSISTISQCKGCKYQLLCGGGCTYKALKKGNEVLCGNCAEFYEIFNNYLEYLYNE